MSSVLSLTFYDFCQQCNQAKQTRFEVSTRKHRMGAAPVAFLKVRSTKSGADRACC